MLITVLKVLYVVIAVMMSVAILMQRGAGAQAGSGFGAGASATVFGARGSANFLTSFTKWCAVAFFGLSLGIAYMITHTARTNQQVTDAGVMSGFGAETPAPAQAPGSGATPAAGNSEVPAPTGAAAPSTIVPTAIEVAPVPAEAAPATPGSSQKAAPGGKPAENASKVEPEKR